MKKLVPYSRAINIDNTLLFMFEKCKKVLLNSLEICLIVINKKLLYALRITQMYAGTSVRLYFNNIIDIIF